MEQQEVILKDFSDQEKGAYLGAIASLATADQEASEEELEYIMALADAAQVSEEQKEAVMKAAKELSGDELIRCLDILKNSQLKFSLITDLISFAETDQQYSEEEKTNIQKIAQHLGIDQQQYASLDQFVKKTSQLPNASEEIRKPGFLSAMGLNDSFKKSGIDMGSLTKGFLGVVGPMLLAGLVGRGMRGRRNTGMGGGLGGMLGGGLGGMLGGSGGGLGGMLGGSGGGSGGMFGGGGMGSGGGLGSLISSLSGGRGYSRTGGLLGKILGI